MMKWDLRFSEQLKWTAELRDNLYNKAMFSQKESLLHIGCSTGEKALCLDFSDTKKPPF